MTYDFSLADSASIESSVALYPCWKLHGIDVLAFHKSGDSSWSNSGNTFLGFIPSGAFIDLSGTTSPDPLRLAFDKDENDYAANAGNDTTAKFNVDDVFQFG